MELSKCIRCGKLFTRIRITVCPSCESEEEKEIFEVSRYIKDHPNSTLDEVSDALNVYLEDISRWIEEKRLEVHIHLRASLKCESCGAPNTSGRICKDCQKKLLVDPLQELKLPSGGAVAGKSISIYKNRKSSGSVVGKYRGI